MYICFLFFKKLTYNCHHLVTHVLHWLVPSTIQTSLLLLKPLRKNSPGIRAWMRMLGGKCQFHTLCSTMCHQRSQRGVGVTSCVKHGNRGTKAEDTGRCVLPWFAHSFSLTCLVSNPRWLRFVTSKHPVYVQQGCGFAQPFAFTYLNRQRFRPLKLRVWQHLAKGTMPADII